MGFEDYSFVAVFCIAIVPILVLLGKIRSHRNTVIRAMIILWLTMPVAIIWLALTWRIPVEDEQAEFHPIEKPSDGYLSSKSCKSCHPDTHASWHASYHRTMTQMATPEIVVGNFDDVELSNSVGTYRLTRQENQFWVDMPDPFWVMRFRKSELARRLSSGELSEELQKDWKDYQAGNRQTDALREALNAIGRSIESDIAGRPPRLQRPLVMTTGSHHQQAYWYPSGFARELGLLPFVYLIEEQRWIPREATFLRPPSELPSQEMRQWNVVCIHCHATHGQPRLQAPDKLDTRAAEFGIACEACHGPGERHVEINRNPLHRYARHLAGDPDPTIVQPARLSHRLSSQVCGQCHGIFSLHDKQNLENSWSVSPYRPGEDLEKARFLVRPAQQENSQRLREGASGSSSE